MTIDKNRMYNKSREVRPHASPGRAAMLRRE
nr:MAG TPA: hypothetical protein [Caudoviricetes sp.]